MEIMDKHITKGRRTASRIWGKTAVVLLAPRDNKDKDNHLFNLPPAGTYFWKLLKRKPKIKEVIASFAKKYEIEQRVAKKQVMKFIKEMSEAEMIELLDVSDE